MNIEECPICYEEATTTYVCGHPVCDACKSQTTRCYYRCPNTAINPTYVYSTVRWDDVPWEYLQNPDIDPPYDEDYLVADAEGNLDQYIAQYKEAKILEWMEEEGLQ